jgi:nucleotide-binding universal stress UspA family protein
MKHYTSIVVGVDFTPCSGVALAQAIRLAKGTAGHVHVIHIIDTLVVADMEEVLSQLQREIREGLMAAAQAEWETFSGSIPGARGLPLEVFVNNRSVGIQHAIRQQAAQLLVLGAFGQASPDVGIGTVATSCVRRCPADVLLVRDSHGGTGPFRCVVVGVDFSPTSRRALAQAAMLAHSEGAVLHVLHVYSPPWKGLAYKATHVEGASSTDSPALHQEHRQGVEKKLSEFCQPVLEPYASITAHLKLFDYTGHRSGLVEYAASVKADLIVLGTRGRSNVRDLILGSTAERALEQSRCSVLAVSAMDDVGDVGRSG